MLYTLFIERPRAGADPVPYGPLHKTKLLVEAEAWVAAPVLSEKAAANVREGDLFTARYNDTKLKLSRVAAFGQSTDNGIAVCTAQRVEGFLVRNWWSNDNGAELLQMAADAPRQLLVIASCSIVRDALEATIDDDVARATIDLAEQWAHGKADVADVQQAAQNTVDAAYAAVRARHQVVSLLRYAAASAAGAAYRTTDDTNAASNVALAMSAFAEPAAAHGARAISLRDSAGEIRRVIKLPDAVFGAVTAR